MPDKDCKHCEHGRRTVKQLARSLSISEVLCAERIIKRQIPVQGFDPLTHTYTCEYCHGMTARGTHTIKELSKESEL